MSLYFLLKHKKRECVYTMEKLIDIVNKLQELYASSDEKVKMDLPQIVVVGSQSSGKSSVLEHMVGRSFLPRGIGIVTRCPLVLQMVHSPKDTVDFAIFSHNPKKSFTDYKQIRKEIEDETERLAGANKGICNKSITLRMYSSSFIDLTLIDLPGIVQNPVGDQPPDIDKQVKKLIHKYIENQNCLILAVSPANTDLATSESIRIARDVDPEGERTLAVITKIDIMDQGTNARDMLNGKIIPVKLGIVGVVNRSQKDIQDDKSIADSLSDEEKFFKNHYPDIASSHGSGYLAKTVQGLLLTHIKSCLPNLKRKVVEKLERKRQELDDIKETTTDKNGLLRTMLSDFSRAYVSIIKGKLTDIETNELIGGARINYVFREFTITLNRMEALAGLQESHIQTAIMNASGVKPEIFVPEAAFEKLVKKQIEKFKNPSLKCVELVLEEMKTILKFCVEDKQLGLNRYTEFQTELGVAMKTILQKGLIKSEDMVNSFIEVQLARINIDHQEFFPNLPQSLILTQMNQQDQLRVNLPLRESNDKRNFDLKLINTLIESYYAIVRKIIQDTIPKIIMYCLINTVMDRLESDLISLLNGKGDELLADPQSVIDKRKVLRKEIARLEDVEMEIRNFLLNIHEHNN